MKTKAYSLSELAQLQKDLAAQARAQEKAAAAARAAQLQNQRINQEFAQELSRNLRGITPLAQKDRYIHPPRPLPDLPTLPEKRRAAFEQKKQERQAAHKKQHNTHSDQFDASHLRDADTGSYVRKGVPDALLKKLQKGHWPVAARLDLHGQTVEEARIACSAFIYQAVQQHLRVVSITHGQGFGAIGIVSAPSAATPNSPHQPADSTLKAHVRNWLVQQAQVLAYCTAPRDAGGAGAVLILLPQKSDTTTAQTKKGVA